MFKNLLRILDHISPPKPIYAHCDIPCGIYDPHHAQMSAHTVIRMVNLIKEAKGDPHDVARLTRVKEDHAEAVKHEVRIIWGDYFKPEHIEKHDELHDLVFEIMKLASKARQEVDEAGAKQLLTKVQEFSEIFWETKGVQTARIKSNYPTEGEIVLPK